jgi:hypothetical protein
MRVAKVLNFGAYMQGIEPSQGGGVIRVHPARSYNAGRAGLVDG